jgi:hypothetical protein
MNVCNFIAEPFVHLVMNEMNVFVRAARPVKY